MNSERIYISSKFDYRDLPELSPTQVRRLNQPSLQSGCEVEPYWVWFGTWVERRLERALARNRLIFVQKSCPHLSVSRLLYWVLVGEGTRKVSWDILLTALSRTNMAASGNGNYITSIAPFHNLVCFWGSLDRELFFPLSLRCRRVPLQLLPSGLYVTSSEMCRMYWFRFVSSSKDASLLLTRWSYHVLIEFCVFVTLFTFGFILVFRLWCRNG